MKTMQEWFQEYGESHQHPVNKKFHYICVPIIFWCVLAFFWLLPTPEVFPNVIWLNWCTIFILPALAFYARLSIVLSIEMLVLSLVCCLSFLAVSRLGENILGMTSVSLFVLAWIGQFIGHHYEGKKPSFFKDLQFLLIGPAWVAHSLSGKK